MSDPFLTVNIFFNLSTPSIPDVLLSLNTAIIANITHNKVNGLFSIVSNAAPNKGQLVSVAISTPAALNTIDTIPIQKYGFLNFGCLSKNYFIYITNLS